MKRRKENGRTREEKEKKEKSFLICRFSDPQKEKIFNSDFWVRFFGCFVHETRSRLGRREGGSSLRLTPSGKEKE